MKYFPVLALVLVLVSCKYKQNDLLEEHPTDLFRSMTSSDTAVATKVTPDELKETVYYLASDELEGRATGTAGVEKAAVYIENKLKSYGIPPYFTTYRDSFKVKDLDGYNIVGFIEGSDLELRKEIIILGAHYDHIGIGKTVDGDSIANGANDDASGTAAVLAMAKYFSHQKNNRRSILFTLYSAEEMGLVGSTHLAQRLKEQEMDLYTMINMEMVGVPMADKKYMAYVTGFEVSNIADRMNNYVNDTLLGSLPQAKKFQLFSRSDNYPFFKAFNRPSHAISTFDFTNFDYYHHVGDEADKMDYEFMADLVNQLIPAFEAMSNTTTKEIKIHE